MNQAVTFSGTPEIIHNGGTSVEWTGSAVQGSWNFADAGKISITGADSNDEATFAEETPTTIDISTFTALTGEITLTTYAAANNSLPIFFDNGGTQVGDTLDLEDFIDTTLIGSAQTWVINLDLFNFASNTVDGFSIRVTRAGGAKPTFSLDDITLEDEGVPLIFKATTPVGTKFHIDEVRIRIEDAVSSVLTDGSMPAIDPATILGVSALSNGILFSRVQRGETLFTATFKSLGDFFATGSNLINVTGNATNVGITLVVEFPFPIILDGARNDFISFTINDDLSGLTRFTAAARGGLEI